MAGKGWQVRRAWVGKPVGPHRKPRLFQTEPPGCRGSGPGNGALTPRWSADAFLFWLPAFWFRLFSANRLRLVVCRQGRNGGVCDYRVWSWSSPGLVATFHLMKESVFHTENEDPVSGFQRFANLNACGDNVAARHHPEGPGRHRQDPSVPGLTPAAFDPVTCVAEYVLCQRTDA